MSLEPRLRVRVEEYVRPLYTELDGVDTFSQVTALERRLAVLSRNVAHDGERLELLVLFHGVVSRLGNLTAGGRWQLFLRGLGLEREAVLRLRAGLERFSTAPQTVEEALLHDAALLERAGVRASVARLLAAGRKRAPLDRALAQLDPGPDPERFLTPAGRALASARYAAAMGWIDHLRGLVAEEDRS